MAGVYAFDKSSASKIAKAVRQVLNGGSLAGAPNGSPTGGNQCITAKLTSRGTGGSTSLYAWSQVRRDSGTWTIVSNGLTGTVSERPAVALSASATDQTDSIVVLVRTVLNDGTDTLPCWVIAGVALPPGTLFRVNLSQTGGSQGNKTTAASWTYTATSLEGATLGTGLSPEWPREPGRRTTAVAGMGYFDSSENFVLSVAFEVRLTGAVCPTP